MNASKNSSYSPISVAQFFEIQVPQGLHARLELRRKTFQGHINLPLQTASNLTTGCDSLSSNDQYNIHASKDFSSSLVDPDSCRNRRYENCNQPTAGTAPSPIDFAGEEREEFLDSAIPSDVPSTPPRYDAVTQAEEFGLFGDGSNTSEATVIPKHYEIKVAKTSAPTSANALSSQPSTIVISENDVSSFDLPPFQEELACGSPIDVLIDLHNPSLRGQRSQLMTEDEALNFLLESSVPKLKFKELEAKYKDLKSKYDEILRRQKVSEHASSKLTVQVRSLSSLKSQLADYEKLVREKDDELQKLKDEMTKFRHQEQKDSVTESPDNNRSELLQEIMDLRILTNEQQNQLTSLTSAFEQKMMLVEEVKSINEALEVQLQVISSVRERTDDSQARTAGDLNDRIEKLSQDLSLKESQLRDAMSEVARLRQINTYLRQSRHNEQPGSEVVSARKDGRGGGESGGMRDGSFIDMDDDITRLLQLERENADLKDRLAQVKRELDETIAEFATSTMNFEAKACEAEKRLTQKAEEVERMVRLFNSVLRSGDIQAPVSRPPAYMSEGTVDNSLGGSSLMSFARMVGDGASFSGNSQPATWEPEAGYDEQRYRQSDLEFEQSDIGVSSRSLALIDRIQGLLNEKHATSMIHHQLSGEGRGSAAGLGGVGSDGLYGDCNHEDQSMPVSSSSAVSLLIESCDTRVGQIIYDSKRVIHGLENEISAMKRLLSAAVGELQTVRQDYRVTMSAISESLMDDRRASEELLASKIKQVEDCNREIILLKMRNESMSAKNKELANFADSMYEYQRELTLYDTQLQMLQTQCDSQVGVIEQSVTEIEDLKSQLRVTTEELESTKHELDEKNIKISGIEQGFVSRISELNSALQAQNERFRMVAEVTKDVQQAKGEADEKVRELEDEIQKLSFQLYSLQSAVSANISEKSTAVLEAVQLGLGVSQAHTPNKAGSSPKPSAPMNAVHLRFKANFHSAAMDFSEDEPTDLQLLNSASTEADNDSNLHGLHGEYSDGELSYLRQTCAVQADQLAHLRQCNANLEEYLAEVKHQAQGRKDLLDSLGIADQADIKNRSLLPPRSAQQSMDTGGAMSMSGNEALNNSLLYNFEDYQQADNTTKIKTLQGVIQEERDNRKFFEDRVAILSAVNTQLTLQLEKSTEWTQPNQDRMARLEKQLAALSSKLAVEIAEKASVTKMFEDQVAQLTSAISQMDKMLIKSEDLLRREVALRLEAEAQVEYVKKQSDSDRILWEEKLRRVVWEVGGGLASEDLSVCNYTRTGSMATIDAKPRSSSDHKNKILSWTPEGDTGECSVRIGGKVPNTSLGGENPGARYERSDRSDSRFEKMMTAQYSDTYLSSPGRMPMSATQVEERSRQVRDESMRPMDSELRVSGRLSANETNFLWSTDPGAKESESSEFFFS